jgi:SPP1 family predicted phage head-tail adaptor
MVNAGRLDRRITLERRVAGGRDSRGGLVETWEPLATVWAGVKYGSPDGGSGKEGEAASRVVGFLEAAFTIRWRADVTSGCRIRFDGYTWNITNVSEKGRRDVLVLMATAEKV